MTALPFAGSVTTGAAPSIVSLIEVPGTVPAAVVEEVRTLRQLGRVA